MNDKERQQGERDLSALIAAAARQLQTPGTPSATRDQITLLAVRSINEVEMASISVSHPDGLMESLAATDSVAEGADTLQAEHREGPCFDAARLGLTVVTGDVATDARWPAYGPAAAELGIRAQMATAIFTTGHNLLALNLYATKADSFNDCRHTVELYASQAGSALGFADSAEQHDEAMKTRGIIGQAIGIAMERFGLDEARAFAFLIRISRDGNIKLHDVATELVGALNEKNTRDRRHDS